MSFTKIESEKKKHVVAGSGDIFFKHVVGSEETHWGAERVHQLDLLNKQLFLLTKVTVDSVSKTPKGNDAWKGYAKSINEGVETSLTHSFGALHELLACDSHDWEDAVRRATAALSKKSPRAASGIIITDHDILIQTSDSAGVRDEVSILSFINAKAARQKRRKSIFQENVQQEDVVRETNTSSILAVFDAGKAMPVARDAFLKLSFDERAKLGCDPDGRVFVGLVTKDGITYAAMLNVFNIEILYVDGAPELVASPPTHEYELLTHQQLHLRETRFMGYQQKFPSDGWRYDQTAKAVKAMQKAR